MSRSKLIISPILSALLLAACTVATTANHVSATVPTTTTFCNPNCTKLLSRKAWRREQGYWVGNYSLLGADGAPFTSPSWPYGFGAYLGFIRIELDGPCLTQRNIFVYPPISRSKCRARRAAGSLSVVGNGTCAINGNERVFQAFQTASDCQGNLAGPFFSFSTDTKIIDDERVLYTVRDANGFISQSQQTILGDGWRIRSAVGVSPDGAASFVSFYRERKVSKAQFFNALQDARRRFNVRTGDLCKWQTGNFDSGVTCEQLFDIPRCKFRASSPRCKRQRKHFRWWLRRARRCSMKA